MQDTTEVIMEETMEYAIDTAATAVDYAAASAASGADPLQAYIAMLGPIFYGIAIFFAIVIILSFITNWIIFEKAGRQGWESLIPFYNLYLFFQIIGKSLWNILWLILPFVGPIVFLVKVMPAFARSFGKGTGFAWGLALFPIIFQAIIAFDKSIVYAGPNGANLPKEEDED